MARGPIASLLVPCPARARQGLPAQGPARLRSATRPPARARARRSPPRSWRPRPVQPLPHASRPPGRRRCRGGRRRPVVARRPRGAPRPRALAPAARLPSVIDSGLGAGGPQQGVGGGGGKGGGAASAGRCEGQRELAAARRGGVRRRARDAAGACVTGARPVARAPRAPSKRAGWTLIARRTPLAPPLGAAGGTGGRGRGVVLPGAAVVIRRSGPRSRRAPGEKGRWDRPAPSQPFQGRGGAARGRERRELGRALTPASSRRAAPLDVGARVIGVRGRESSQAVTASGTAAGSAVSEQRPPRPAPPRPGPNSAPGPPPAHSQSFCIVE
jgi:hypothetical protein